MGEVCMAFTNIEGVLHAAKVSLTVERFRRITIRHTTERDKAKWGPVANYLVCRRTR